MEMRALGREGPEISVVGFGAWEAGGDAWGPNRSDELVIEAIRTAIDSGMTWIDTAEVYGNGRSEELVGRAVEGRRDQVRVFTKVAPRETGGGGTGLRPEEIRSAIRASLGRLRTDHVDLYQIHWPDSSGVPLEDSWDAMAGLQDQGLAAHIGVSNFDRTLIERCLPIRHVDSVQNQFSLLFQEDGAELLPWLQAEGIGYLAYGPLAFGLLTGALSKDSTIADWRSADADVRALFGPGAFQRNLQRVERMRPVAEQLATSPATLALRWVVEQPGVTAAIAGSRDPTHVSANARAGDLQLDNQARESLDAIFG